VRIGIASGSVVVGDTGAGDASVPKFAVGETPNLAARVQSLAGSDEIVIAASTRRLIGAAFDLSDLGPHTLKGFAVPVQAWRIAGVAATEGRFEAAHGGHFTPLVGRESELALVLERWQRAKEGEGQIVLLSGEAGIGKSRVTQVLRERISGQRHVELRYQCSPYHTNSALYPVIDQFKRAARFDAIDDTRTKLSKMEALLHQALSDVSAVAPLFAALLSIATDGRYPPLDLAPQAQKDATLKALAGQVLALAAKQPVLMIFEDAHWIDPTTQEALDLLLPAVADRSVMVVVTYRPEYEPPWSRLAHATALPLIRLSRKQAMLLTEAVGGGKPLPKIVLDQIVAKTDGVPLFVEELTKTVLESGLVAESDDAYRLTAPLPDLAIPSTLQDSLMARLDRVAVTREVAQIAACIGRQFSRDLVAAVSALEATAVDEALRQLVDGELAFRSGASPGDSYVFKHALVQDAAYNSLLKAKRQAIHRRIAEALQSQVSATVEPAPETLAHHYMEAAVFDKAARYCRLAAESAAARFANTEAIAHARKGLAALTRVPPSTERVDSELALRMSLVASLGLGDRYDEALAELDAAQTLAAEHKRVLDLARIHHARGNILFPQGQAERCFTEHLTALEFAKQAQSAEDEARALGGICDAHYMGRRMQQAYDYADRCVTLCRARGLEGIEIAYLPMRAVTHWYCLRLAPALEDCGSTISMAARVGQARSDIVARCTSTAVLLEQHEFDHAEEHARRGLELVDRIGARRFAPVFYNFFAQVRLDCKDRAGATERIEAGLAASRETGVAYMGPCILGTLALVTTDPARRREALQEGQALLERGCASHNYFWFYRYAIESSLAEGDWDATDTYTRALAGYFCAEPMPWAEFIVAAGRALLEFGRRGPDGPVIAQLRGLRDEAARLGIKRELARLDAALQRA
jgi:predicted ATPase